MSPRGISSTLPPELAKLQEQIRKYAEGYGLDFFETIFEMVDYDQMNSLAALGGFPVRYPHWRFGMDYDQLSKGYTWGLQKIYEMVINTNPSYAYLLKSNATVDQKTVMAHVYGHVDFFKNNYWFSKTNRKMLDTMANHAVRIRTFMDGFGHDTVESFIDNCLSLETLVDPYSQFAKAPKKNKVRISQGEEEVVKSEPGKLKTNRNYMEQYINPPNFLADQKRKMEDRLKKSKRIPPEPQKDVIAFLMEYSPLESWQYEVLRMISDEIYYFIPQAQTKIMNEGWASYWHTKIMSEKALKDSELIDYADHHAGTMAMQPGRINPYKIGIELFRDIEDRWNRGKFGKDYDDCNNMVEKSKWNKNLGKGLQKIFEVRRVCNDVTFIDEFLSEEFVERLKLYTYNFNRRTNQYEIADRDYRKIKEKLLFQLTNLGRPFISVIDGNYQNKGELLLQHQHQGLDLDAKWSRETLKAIAEIWKRPVNVETEVDGQKKLLTYQSNEFTEKFL